MQINNDLYFILADTPNLQEIAYLIAYVLLSICKIQDSIDYYINWEKRVANEITEQKIFKSEVSLNVCTFYSYLQTPYSLKENTYHSVFLIIRHTVITS